MVKVDKKLVQIDPSKLFTRLTAIAGPDDTLVDHFEFEFFSRLTYPQLLHSTCMLQMEDHCYIESCGQREQPMYVKFVKYVKLCKVYKLCNVKYVKFPAYKYAYKYI